MFSILRLFGSPYFHASYFHISLVPCFPASWDHFPHRCIELVQPVLHTQQINTTRNKTKLKKKMYFGTKLSKKRIYLLNCLILLFFDFRTKGYQLIHAFFIFQCNFLQKNLYFVNSEVSSKLLLNQICISYPTLFLTIKKLASLLIVQQIIAILFLPIQSSPQLHQAGRFGTLTYST